MSVLNTKINDSAWRLIKTVGEPSQAGFKIIRRLEKMHSNSVDTIALRKSIVKVVDNPFADSDTAYKQGFVQVGDTKGDTRRRGYYHGRFIQSKLDVDVDDEKAFEVTQTLTKVLNVDSWADISAHEPIIGRVKEIKNAFGDGDYPIKSVVIQHKYLNPATDTKVDTFTDTKFATLAPSSYKLINRKLTEQDDGTSTLDILFSLPSGDSWGNPRFAAPIKYKIHPKSDWEQRVLKWYGINSSADTHVIADLSNKSKCDTGFIVKSYEQSKAQDGTRDWTQIQFEYKTDSVPYISNVSLGLGWNSNLVSRTWDRLLDTKASVLSSPTRIAQKSFSYNSLTYTHSKLDINRNWDGTTTLTQIGERPKIMYSLGSGADVTDTTYRIRFGKRNHVHTKIITKLLETNSFPKADSWARASALDTSIGYKEGKVEGIGDGRYRSYKVAYSLAVS